MAVGRRSDKAEKDLSERQRFWLKHLRAADRKGESLKAHAERLGLSAHSMYEAKRRLRAYGLIAPGPQRRVPSPKFVRVARADVNRAEPACPASLRVRLANGTLLEWSEAPQGAALRELVGLVS